MAVLLSRGILVNWFPASNDKMYKISLSYDDSMTWTFFPYYSPFVRGIDFTSKGRGMLSVDVSKAYVRGSNGVNKCTINTIWAIRQSAWRQQATLSLFSYPPKTDGQHQQRFMSPSGWTMMWAVSIVGSGTCSTARGIFLSRADIFRCWTW